MDSSIEVIRVPGGWIYKIWNDIDEYNSVLSTVFIPFSDEYQDISEKIFKEEAKNLGKRICEFNKQEG